MTKKLVTLVIPIHLEEPSELEKVSLSQTLKVLNKFPITFMAPVGLNTAWYEGYCKGKATINFERFKWKGAYEFGKLMVSYEFYERFLPYEFILICHLDAFVFRDELEQWCHLDYDYTGSVIYNPTWYGSNTPLKKRLGFTSPEYYSNGGFALKKVQSFYDIAYNHRRYIRFYLWLRTVRKQSFFDDIFVAQRFPTFGRFRMPPLSLAAKFGAAYEFWDERDLPFTTKDLNSLPFGIHGWIQYHPEYWKPCIKQFGYDV